MLKYFHWRTYKAIYLHVMRTPVPPEVLARGVALGLFVGLLIPMGLQIAVVLPLAFLLKAAKIPAIAFTFITNHLTVIFIYPVQCWIGSYLMLQPIRYETLTAQLRGVIDAADMKTFMAEISRLGLQLGASFFLGGLLFGVIAVVIAYPVTLHLARRFQARLEARRNARKNL